MFRIALALGILAFLGSCRTTPMVTAAAVSDLAPTGKLRAAINFGNPILASRARRSRRRARRGNDAADHATSIR
jgi:hypothetical protein